ncbi:MAG: hypothetical protein M3367_01670, partial [Acidobacteriota bacterium]|nr:hypothetical protein [Acidobacteriota bacterium]
FTFYFSFFPAAQFIVFLLRLARPTIDAVFRQSPSMNYQSRNQRGQPTINRTKICRKDSNALQTLSPAIQPHF